MRHLYNIFTDRKRVNLDISNKCTLECIACSRQTNRFNNQLPSSITYKIQNVFPSSIVAAPLAYGRAELIKTTITFKYDQYFIDKSFK